MKLNILGTEYELKVMTEEECPKLKTLEANGLAELYSKELIIKKLDKTNKHKEFENIQEYTKKTIRHEIVHAFFHESGLHQNYCNDELLVDWLAFQIPKMAKVMIEADALSVEEIEL